MKFISYLKARLAEASTWAAFVAGATAAAALAAPWSYVAMGCAAVGVLVPEKSNVPTA